MDPHGISGNPQCRCHWAATGWTRLGENVAAGYPTIAAVTTGWMNSPGHCQNLLDSRFTHLGAQQATNGSISWTQDFGTSGAC